LSSERWQGTATGFCQRIRTITTKTHEDSAPAGVAFGSGRRVASLQREKRSFATSTEADQHLNKILSPFGWISYPVALVRQRHDYDNDTWAAGLATLDLDPNGIHE
jgi:hypothetical protein